MLCKVSQVTTSFPRQWILGKQPDWMGAEFPVTCLNVFLINKYRQGWKNLTQRADFQNQTKVCHEASDLSFPLAILFGTKLKFIDSFAVPA